MIPKVIHYCWFGGKPLPQSARRCIASWRKYLPDYEIKEWNETNFEVDMIPYTSQAYAAKMYAFVSDFARFWVLHEHGGVYFDTDVELIATVNDILQKGAYMGMEAKTTPDQEFFYVAPGLGCACEAANPLWKHVIDVYRKLPSFSLDTQGTICSITTDALKTEGIQLNGQLITSEHVTIYPPDYFCPQAMMGAPIYLTENTRSIHHYDCLWMPWSMRLRRKLMSFLPFSLQQKIRRLFRRV